MASVPPGLTSGAPGNPESAWLGVQLTPQIGWHTYWKNPGDSGLATQLKWTLPPGWQAGPVQWPTPDVFQLGDNVNYGYGHPVLLTAQFQPSSPLPSSKKPQSPLADVQVTASWLVCKTECIPESVQLRLSLPATGGFAEHDGAFKAAENALPVTAPQVQAQATLQGDHLLLRFSGLPKAWQGQPLWVMPEMQDILSAVMPLDPQSSPKWQQGDTPTPTWQVLWPLSGLREQSPKRLRWLVRLQSSPLGAFWVEAPIQGEWPAAEVGNNHQAPLSAQPVTISRLSWGELLIALLGAFLGGLVLNLMPCVFPVLAIKLLSLLKSPPSSPSIWGQSLRAQCLAYSLGVVASFLALGGLMLVLRAGGTQLGWGFQLQSPTVVALLVVLFTVMALNLAGLFEWRGQWAGNLTQVSWRHPLLNAVFSGVLAVLIASPCTAPFMGASLGLTLSLPATTALAVFAALGLGMSLPYLLLGLLPAAAPWWVHHLPKPGVWMQTFKQVMAFPLLATVLWLLWVLGQQVGLEGVMVMLGILLTLAGALWAWGLPVTPSTSGPLGLRQALMAVFIALCGWLVWAWGDWVIHPSPLSLTSGNAAASPASRGSWQVWHPGLAESLAAQGRPVFVDFTAAWCVTCQFNKHATLADAGLLRDFAQHQVALLRADWTRQDPDITQALNHFGRSGVPVYVAYVPGRSPVVLSELLSVDEVRTALNFNSN
jgi:thiol:disulfide interchange protein DsbD